jgi:hypothetical protein
MIYKSGYLDIETAAIDDEEIQGVINSLRQANENLSASDVREGPKNDLNETDSATTHSI